MRRGTAVLLALALPVAASAEVPFGRLVPMPERPVPGAAMRNDSLLTYSDGTYSGGFAWYGDGVAPPDYGAFAECFSGTWELAALVLDFVQYDGTPDGHTYDVWVWSDNGGIPGEILYAMTDLVPGLFPDDPLEYVREIVELPSPLPVSGSWWVGFRGNWPGQWQGWYLAIDLDTLEQGCVMTNVSPNLPIPLPSGWQHLYDLFGPFRAIGISAMVRDVTPVATRSTSWGAIKSLYFSADPPIFPLPAP